MFIMSFLFQEEVLPDDVATEVAQNEKLIDGMPGVLVKGEDGSLKKIVTPGVQMPLPDFKPEPTRSAINIMSQLDHFLLQGLTRVLRVF